MKRIIICWSVTCCTCGGRGTVWEDGDFSPCPTCGGDGTVDI